MIGRKRKIEVETKSSPEVPEEDAEEVEKSGPEDIQQSEQSDSEETDSVETTENIENSGEIEQAENPQVSALEASLEVSQKESRENYDKYLRALAELENFKKRAQKERSDILRYAGEHMARDMLEVLDNLRRAVTQEVPGSNDELLAGVKMVLQQFEETFGRHGVEGEESLGKQFDPEKHEALSILPSAEHEPGIIVEEFKRGYFFKDKLLRPAQVVVAKEVEEQGADSEGDSEVEDEAGNKEETE